MRPLTNNERFLLGVLGTVVLVIGSFLGLKWILDAQTSLDLKLKEAQGNRAVAEVELHDEGYGGQRLQWIAQHQSVLGDPGEAQAQVLEKLKDAAGANKLEIQQQSVGEVEHGPAGASITVLMDAKGSMESVIRWVNTFQTTHELYAIEKFSIKVDGGDSKAVVCSVRIRKFFKEPSGS